MGKKIQMAGAAVPRIRVTGPAVPRVAPAVVAEALGGELAPGSVGSRPGPLTLYALRSEILRRRQSTGGRPGIEGTTQRAKIPVSDRDWHELEEMALSLSASGFVPSPGQVASVLLNLAIQTVKQKAELGEPNPLAGLFAPSHGGGGTHVG